MSEKRCSEEQGKRTLYLSIGAFMLLHGMNTLLQLSKLERLGGRLLSLYIVAALWLGLAAGRCGARRAGVRTAGVVP